MLGKVVRLLTARERMAVVGSAEAVRTVTVPCYWQGPYGDTPCRPDGSKHRPGSVVDRSNTRHRRPVVTRVKPRSGRHLFILRVVAGGDAAPLLESIEPSFDGVAQPVERGVERGWSTPGRPFGPTPSDLVFALGDGVFDSPGHCQLEQSEGDFRRFASAIHQVACDV